MNERLKFLGRLEERRLEAERLRLRLRGLRDSLRDVLDPFETVEDLDGEKLAALAVEFADLQILCREAIAEMALIRKTLGR
ncbi:MAG TPA: hypothetical protein PK250_16630 [Syntrophobacter fumaroxidans]|nr:hypothetical protein [Syntrophobacter fumaroxidans]